MDRTLVLALLAAGAGSSGCTLSTDLDGLAKGAGAQGGAGQAASASAASASAGGTGGAAAGEICTDGIDNDSDQLVDCADPDCAEFSCAEAPPEGWSGPAILYLGADAAPACPGGALGVDGGNGMVNAPPASCSACTCGDPAGATCKPSSVTFFDSTDCTNQKKVQAGNAFDACDENGTCCVKSAIAATLLTEGGACAPGQSTPTAQPPTWSTSGRVCTASLGGGCGAGSVCAPKPAPPFGPTPCIFQDGDVDCPPGPFSEKTSLQTALDDRGCSACACGAPTGVACAGHMVLYGSDQCAGLSDSVPNDGATCVLISTGDVKSATSVLDSGPSGGTCPAAGGDPTGGVSPGPGVTVCCAP